MRLIGAYDIGLVALSGVVAVLASYTALDLATRVRAASGWARTAWLGAAAVAMGGGIWSMHFIGMLAFSLPGMEVGYDWALTLLSLILPIAVTAFGFFVAVQPGTGWVGQLLSGLVMGLGIVGMHYTGMSAMQMPADQRHDWLWVAISVLIAVAAATVALGLAFERTSARQRVLAAFAMGVAVTGMHYAAMHGASFIAMPEMAAAIAPSVGRVPLALWIACTTVVILVLGLIAAMADRQLGHRAIREAEALRQAFETSHLYQGMTSVEGVLTYANATALAGVKAKLEEVINRPLWETPWFADTPGAPAAIRSAFAKAAAGEAQDMRITLNLPIGLRAFEFSMRPVRNAAGAVTAVVPEAMDVTARVSAEAALHQAQKMEAIGNLSGGIAHDFNNLLMAVLGSLELLRKKLPDDPKTQRLISNAVEGATRGVALTQRMLSFARRQDLRPEPVDLPNLVRGMSELLTRSIGPSVRIETHFPLGLPKAMVDANQLELALLNLVLNARDAMPNGGAITIGAREDAGAPQNDPGEERYVCLSVADSGMGMDEETLRRAQEPFFTTKGVGKGTGLGLSMAHGLAEQSRGRLTIESRLGQGTTAEIWLPTAPAESARPKPVSHAEPPRGAAPSLSVLVVDDDPLVLENTVALLEDLGHRAAAAGSGREAMDQLAHMKPPDLVLTDYAMPEMTGLKLAEWIRSAHPHVRILMMTGFADIPAGAPLTLPKLSKPFDQAALAAAIEAVTDASDGRGEVVPFRSKGG